MPQIAIQEDMLPGNTSAEQFQQAQQLGIAGIELWANNLDEKMTEIVTAMAETGVAIAAVNHGHRQGILSPSPAEREQALADLRQSICDAADLGADGVIIVPHLGAPSIPDLTPFLSAEGLEAELLLAHLRTLEDYAAAMGVRLFIRSVNRTESHFLNRLDQAAAIARKRNQPSIRIAAGTYHMALEESDIAASLRTHADMLGYVHLADTGRMLPGHGSLDFEAIGAVLHEAGYQGWCTLECGTPGDNEARAAQFLQDVPASLEMLRAAGWQ